MARKADREASATEGSESASGEQRWLDAAILQLAGHEEALVAFLRRLPASMRLKARLALARHLGPTVGSETWRAAWGHEHAALFASEGEPASHAEPGLLARLDRVRALALGEVLDHPGIPWAAAGTARALAGELVAAVDSHVLRAALHLHPQVRAMEGAAGPVLRQSAAIGGGHDAHSAGPAAGSSNPAGPSTAGALVGAADRHAATLWRSADHAADGADAEHPDVLAALARMGSGQALPEAVRRDCERRLGMELTSVRVHLDSTADAAARAVSARAFTLGEDIFFATGAFAPDGAEGRRLLLHELAHVAQGRAGRAGTATGSRASGRAVEVSRTSDPLEREADAVAERAESRAPGRSTTTTTTNPTTPTTCDVGITEGRPSGGRASATRLHRRGASDAQKRQWEDDWNDAGLASSRRHFRGEGRPKGTPKQRYDVLCPLYLGQGIDRPLKYVAENIVDNGKFLGFTTPAHKDIKARLADAESRLASKMTAAGKPMPKLKSVWAFNPRTTSEGNWSNHADGKAVDFDPDTNPRLTDKKQNRVMSELGGRDLNQPVGGATTGESWDNLKSASNKFQQEYNPAGMERRLVELKTQQTAQQSVVDGLDTQLAAVPRGRRASPADKAERTRLQGELKKARQPLKDTVTGITAVSGALATYKKSDDQYSALSTAMAGGQSAIDTAEAELEAAEQIVDPKERRSKKAAARKKLTGLKAKLKKDTKALQRLPNYSLRHWSETGFLTIDKAIVESMTEAGFRWGAVTWPNKKDIMHFDRP